jgi:uncharacterized protein involved in exopolysaccharide biosynthesis
MLDRARLEYSKIREGADFGGRYALSLLEQSRFGPFIIRHWRTLGTCAVASTAIALLYLLAAAPTYTAQTQILIDPGLPNVLRDQTIEPPMAMDSQQVETEIAVLKSEEVALAVIDRLKLADNAAFKPRFLSDYLPDWAVSKEAQSHLEHEKSRVLLANFQKNMSVRRIGVSYAIDVYYTSADPEQAALIANTIAEEYIRFQTEARANAAKIGSEWLEARLSDLRTQMNQSARKMQEHRARRNYSLGSSQRQSSQQEPADAAASGPKPVPEAVTEEDLESTANTYRRIYENYLQSYTATLQRQSFPISNARVITRAAAPLNSSRSTGLLLSLALALGLATGAGIGHVRDRVSAHRRVIATDEASRHLVN